jgi:hypothetical protein
VINPNLLARIMALVKRMESSLYVNATKIGLELLAKKKVEIFYELV